MCDCANQVDKELEKYNTRLVQIVMLTFNAPTKKQNGLHSTIAIATEKIDKKKRGDAKTVMPSYCPFCGKEYKKEDKDV
jgi:hypothetical protein